MLEANVRKMGGSRGRAVGAGKGGGRAFAALTRVVTAGLVIVGSLPEISVIRAERW